MSINLITYANQTVTPTNDAIIYEKSVDQNGIFYGCNVTVSGNNVNITGGYGIVCGREFVVESESIAVTLAPSVPLDGRLYVRLDLADADNPIQLLTAQGGTLPALEQDANVNFVNGVWEMELATFTVGVSVLSDVVETFETIVGSKLAQKVDYIVEQGTSGIWTYRKWASGIAECWGTYTSSNISVASRNGWYSGECTPDNFPTGLFNSVPKMSTNCTTWGTGYHFSFAYNVTSSGCKVGGIRNDLASSPMTVDIFATGTWK